MAFFTDRDPVVDVPWIAELSVAKLRWQAEVYRLANDLQGAAVCDNAADMEARYYEARQVRRSSMNEFGEPDPKWDLRYRQIKDMIRIDRDQLREARQIEKPGWVHEDAVSISYPSDDELVAWLRSN